MPHKIKMMPNAMSVSRDGGGGGGGGGGRTISALSITAPVPLFKPPMFSVISSRTAVRERHKRPGRVS